MIIQASQSAYSTAVCSARLLPSAVSFFPQTITSATITVLFHVASTLTIFPPSAGIGDAPFKQPDIFTCRVC